jgi:hypothetical protein
MKGATAVMAFAKTSLSFDETLHDGKAQASATGPC